MGHFVNVAKKSAFGSQKAITVDVEGQSVAIFSVDGEYYAIGNECTHAGGSLGEGECEGTKVMCPWHGATFDIKTGAALSAPASENVKSYKVRVEGEEIQIEVD